MYLQSQDINPEKASKVLARLNSVNSASELIGEIGVYDEQHALGKRIAQRILTTRKTMGNFQDLNQVAMVPGIGNKRLAIIVCSFSDSPVTS